MRLPEIFGLSTFPVFWPYRYFDSQNKSGILTLVSNVQKFHETYRKSYQNTEIYWIYRNFQYIFDIFDIQQYMSKIYQNFQKLTVSVKRKESVHHICDVCHIRNVHLEGKCIHSKYDFKTILARSGAEKNSFLGFECIFAKNTRFWSNLDSI